MNQTAVLKDPSLSLVEELSAIQLRCTKMAERSLHHWGCGTHPVQLQRPLASAQIEGMRILLWVLCKQDSVH